MSRGALRAVNSDAEKLLSNVKVETFGAATGKYPDGPQYVHYVNRGDLVPVLFGLGLDWNPFRHEGKGAVIHHFNQNVGSLGGTHGLEDVYLKHRVPFDEARAGKF